jgi:hypothetical protein
MANTTPLPLPADPNALEDRSYTRAEVEELIAAERKQARGLVAAMDRSWREAPRAAEASPSAPPSRPRLTLLQGGAA